MLLSVANEKPYPGCNSAPFNTDQQTGDRSLHVVTQAEESNGLRLIGALRVSDGSEWAGLESDFQLLGHSAP
jgi:hypothetical protein